MKAAGGKDRPNGLTSNTTDAPGLTGEMANTDTAEKARNWLQPGMFTLFMVYRLTDRRRALGLLDGG